MRPEYFISIQIFILGFERKGELERSKTSFFQMFKVSFQVCEPAHAFFRCTFTRGSDSDDQEVSFTFSVKTRFILLGELFLNICEKFFVMSEQIERILVRLDLEGKIRLVRIFGVWIICGGFFARCRGNAYGSG